MQDFAPLIIKIAHTEKRNNWLNRSKQGVALSFLTGQHHSVWGLEQQMLTPQLNVAPHRSSPVLMCEPSLTQPTQYLVITFFLIKTLPNRADFPPSCHLSLSHLSFTFPPAGVYTRAGCIKLRTHQKLKIYSCWMIARLLSCDQIAEVEYFEQAWIVMDAKTVSLAIQVHPTAILEHVTDFVCNFITPQIKFTFCVYTS